MTYKTSCERSNFCIHNFVHHCNIKKIVGSTVEKKNFDRSWYLGHHGYKHVQINKVIGMFRIEVVILQCKIQKLLRRQLNLQWMLNVSSKLKIKMINTCGAGHLRVSTMELQVVQDP